MTNRDDAMSLIEGAFKRQLGRTMTEAERQMAQTNVDGVSEDEDADVIAEQACLDAGWNPSWDHESGSPRLVLDLD